MPKVLVFESDSAFAETLNQGLTGFGCEVRVVDDGEAGIAAAESEKPDLILLSIELPRMNGFSVCNKLKRNSGLKKVPLVLMSSEATEETFEQHKRLKTRAEEYVHKPITLLELKAKLSAFIELGEAEEAAVDELDDVVIDEVDADDGDDEMETLTDEAFGNLVSDAAPEVQPAVDIAAAEKPVAAADDVEIDDLELDADDGLLVAEPEEAIEEVELEEAAPSVAARSALSSAETEKVTAELAAQVQKATELTAEVNRLKEALATEEDSRRQLEGKKNAEIELAQKEVDELKAKMESSAGAGTAREFLDLREQLNKKDKEILDVRDQLTSREKEVVKLNDSNIALERGKADLIDSVSDLEKAKSGLERQVASLTADKEQAEKRGDDFKAKSERLGQDLETRTAELASARTDHENTVATRDAQEAALREDHRRALEDAAERAREAEAAAVEEAVRQADERAQAAQEVALTEAAASAAQVQAQAIRAREAEIRSEHDSKMAALHRANEESLRKLRAEHEQATEEALQLAADRLLAREQELADEKAAALAATESAHADATRELLAQKAQSEAERDQKIGNLEADLSTRTTERDSALATIEEKEGRIAQLEADLAATRADLSVATQNLQAETGLLAQARGKWAEDSQSVTSAKEALSLALAELDNVAGRLMP